MAEMKEGKKEACWGDHLDSRLDIINIVQDCGRGAQLSKKFLYYRRVWRFYCFEPLDKELSGNKRASLKAAMPLSKLTNSSLAWAAVATR